MTLTTLISSLAMAMALSTAASAAPPSDPKAEKEVMAAMETWRQALLKKDGAALTRLYHEDIRYGHSSGLVEDKKTAVNHIVTSKADYASVDLIDTKVSVHGDFALVNGRVNYRQVTDGKANDVKLHVMHVWVRTPQGWQMIGRQSTRDGSQ
jgi:ketosteroid isomerase-like protein